MASAVDVANIETTLSSIHELCVSSNDLLSYIASNLQYNKAHASKGKRTAKRRRCSEWDVHVKETGKQHPGTRRCEILKIAQQTYRKQSLTLSSLSDNDGPDSPSLSRAANDPEPTAAPSLAAPRTADSRVVVPDFSHS